AAASAIVLVIIRLLRVCLLLLCVDLLDLMQQLGQADFQMSCFSDQGLESFSGEYAPAFSPQGVCCAGGYEHADAAFFVEETFLDELLECPGGRGRIDAVKGRILVRGHDLLLLQEG